MPTLGDIRPGLELGYKGNAPHIWIACSTCGKERWVVLAHGVPANTHCRLCASRATGTRLKTSNTLLKQSTRPPETSRNGEPFQPGDIQYGKHLGYTNNQVYMLNQCPECQKIQWTHWHDGNHVCCRSCIGKSPERMMVFMTSMLEKGVLGEYAPPTGTPDKPDLGDIRMGHEIGRHNWSRYIWFPCQSCNQSRWVTMHGGKPIYTLCKPCSTKTTLRREHVSAGQLLNHGSTPLTAKGNPQDPRPGDIQRGYHVGLHRSYWYVYHACVDCGKLRWVKLHQGEPDSIRCPSCSRKSPARRAKVSATVRAKGIPKTYGQRRMVGPYIGIRLSPDDPMFAMANKHGIVLEHRLVMARHLKRLLTRTEIVHHKYGEKHDNRIEVLELTSNGKHIKDHNKGYRDGFKKGYADGLDTRMVRLQQETIQLMARVAELEQMLLTNTLNRANL